MAGSGVPACPVVGYQLDTGEAKPGDGGGDGQPGQRPGLHLPRGADLHQGTVALHGPNAEGDALIRDGALELPGGAKQARVLRQRGGLQGAFHFQKSDAPAIGCDDHFGGGDVERRDGVGAKGVAQRLAKRRQIGKRAVGRLALRAPRRRRCQGRGGLQQRLQAVDVFFEHRLAIEPQKALDHLLFRRRVGGIWRRQAALLPTWVAAGQQ